MYLLLLPTSTLDLTASESLAEEAEVKLRNCWQTLSSPDKVNKYLSIHPNSNLFYKPFNLQAQQNFKPIWKI